MAITSIFCNTRNEARQAKIDLNGKIVDNGSDAPKGKRWEVQYEVAPVSDAITELAAIMQAEVQDMALEEVQPKEILGLPKSRTSHASDRQIVLVDRKKNPIMVTYRRSKTKALLAAHLANS